MGDVVNDGESFVAMDLRRAGVLYDPAWQAKREAVLRAMAESRKTWLLLVLLAAVAEGAIVIAMGGLDPVGFGVARFVISVSVPLLLLLTMGIFAWRYFQGLTRQLASLDGADGLVPAVLATIYFIKTNNYLVALKRQGQEWEVRQVREDRLVQELALAQVAAPYKVTDLWEKDVFGKPPIDLGEVEQICLWAGQKLNEPSAYPVPFEAFTKPVIG